MNDLTRPRETGKKMIIDVYLILIKKFKRENRDTTLLVARLERLLSHYLKTGVGCLVIFHVDKMEVV